MSAEYIMPSMSLASIVVLVATMAQSAIGPRIREVPLPLSQPVFAQPLPSPIESSLIIRFEGGDIADNIAQVIDILYRHQLIQLSSRSARKGDTIEKIYKENLDLPGLSKGMFKLAQQLNKNLKSSDYKLNEGDRVSWPEVVHSRYRFAKTFDPTEDRAIIAGLAKNWNYLNIRELKKTSGQLRISFEGYQISVISDNKENVSKARAEIEELGSRNILTYSPSAEGKAHYYSSESVVRWWGRRKTPIALNEQGALSALIGLRSVDYSCSSNCPEVVLIDTPVANHPDLGDAIEGGVPDVGAQALVHDGTQVVREPDSWDLKFHGTYMAGIIGSRDNSFGLVGIDPHAKIVSWNWEYLKDHRDLLADQITQRQEADRPPQIYVMAESWDYGPFSSPARRFRDILAKTLASEGVLLITAAGQLDSQNSSQDEIIDLSVDTPKGPMNLGDLENVVVVTACENCDTIHAHISPTANYSTRGIVHIAAPGSRIPSTVPGGRYMEADGTSPATAITAGLVSAMTRAFPNAYNRPWRAKTRLEITSRPFLIESGDVTSAQDVETGILDGRTAMLDPSKDWVKYNGVDYASSGEVRWKTSVLPVRGAELSRDYISTEDIVRIIRKNDVFVVYSLKREPAQFNSDHAFTHRVLRTGPVRIPFSKPIAAINGQDVSLLEIEDLLLSGPVRFDDSK